MTQIYFKLICHNPSYAHKLPVFWGMQSTTDTYGKDSRFP